VFQLLKRLVQLDVTASIESCSEQCLQTIEHFNGRRLCDDRTSDKSHTEMWQKPTEHAAGSVCYRNALIVTKCVIKVYLMWREKKTNPKPRFKCSLNRVMGLPK